MKSFLKYTLATVVGILIYTVISTLIFFGIVGAIVSASDQSEASIEPNTILYMKLDQSIVDRASDNPFEGFNFATFEADPALGLNDILKNLKKAKEDENIKGIFMELSYIPAGIATIDEIRNGLLDFKESGKFIYTYAEVMTQGAYYLASASDKIYMNPVGTMELKGLRSKVTFFKGALEKLGVEPVIFRHGKFKSAIEPFMLDKMSEANKEQSMTFVQSIWDYMVANIAKSRGLTAAEINQLADAYAIRNTQAAVDHKIIDGSKYRDEVIDELVALTGAEKPEKLEMVKLSKYNDVGSVKKHRKHQSDKIAVIYASGEINSGKGDNQTIGSETLTQALRKARRDSTIKAIVLRVNSPGGSGLASDVIWREVVLAKQAKPLVVSMGDLAASGGYYIACPADVIVANEVTLTGSIGVFGLLLNTQELMNKKLGITFDGIKTNQYADLGDVTRPMTEAEKEIIQGEVEEFYSIFIGKVGDGRKMVVAGVDSIGQGRVWSGVNAKQIGLVDEFGGLERAIAIAAEKANLTDYKTIDLPEQPDPVEELIKQLTGEAKMSILEKELGENYYFYQKLKNVQKLQGIQARMDYDVELY
ncbi:MAG: signal peptide peptidase SppA [Salinivirgaceae bacterium]|nr:signal peptide peptidase SppA [Salinivirgaceae bacterium]